MLVTARVRKCDLLERHRINHIREPKPVRHFRPISDCITINHYHLISSISKFHDMETFQSGVSAFSNRGGHDHAIPHITKKRAGPG